MKVVRQVLAIALWVMAVVGGVTRGDILTAGLLIGIGALVWPRRRAIKATP